MFSHQRLLSVPDIALGLYPLPRRGSRRPNPICMCTHTHINMFCSYSYCLTSTSPSNLGVCGGVWSSAVGCGWVWLGVVGHGRAVLTRTDGLSS